MRRVHEKKAERETNQWYDARFPCARTKLNLHGRRGWPDQAYWLPGGQPLLIEYKADEEEPRTLQAFIQTTLTEHGYAVVTCYTSEEAIAAIKVALHTRGLGDLL